MVRWGRMVVVILGIALAACTSQVDRTPGANDPTAALGGTTHVVEANVEYRSRWLQVPQLELEDIEVAWQSDRYSYDSGLPPPDLPESLQAELHDAQLRFEPSGDRMVLAISVSDDPELGTFYFANAAVMGADLVVVSEAHAVGDLDLAQSAFDGYQREGVALMMSIVADAFEASSVASDTARTLGDEGVRELGPLETPGPLGEWRKANRFER